MRSGSPNEDDGFPRERIRGSHYEEYEEEELNAREDDKLEESEVLDND